MTDEVNFLKLATQVSVELRRVEEQGPEGNLKDIDQQIPIDIRVGRLLFLISRMQKELEDVSNPLIDRWLVEGGSVGKLADVTGISRQTLTRRKKKVKYQE